MRWKEKLYERPLKPRSMNRLVTPSILSFAVAAVRFQCLRSCRGTSPSPS